MPANFTRQKLLFNNSATKITITIFFHDSFSRSPISFVGVFPLRKSWDVHGDPNQMFVWVFAAHHMNRCLLFGEPYNQATFSTRIIRVCFQDFTIAEQLLDFCDKKPIGDALIVSVKRYFITLLCCFCSDEPWCKHFILVNIVPFICSQSPATQSCSRQLQQCDTASRRCQRVR